MTTNDVDELLREADGFPFLTHIARRLADALRAERARTKYLDELLKLRQLSSEYEALAGQLRGVLAHFSPDPTRGPTVAQKAHAFLGGATIHPLAQDEAEANLRAELREARAGMVALAEEKERLRQAALAVLHMRDARDGNGGRLIAKPCSSGSCKGTVCGPAAELQTRLDALAIAASKGAA